MPRLSVEQRHRIVFMRENGHTVQEISILLGISRCAVNHTYQRYLDGNGFYDRPKSGRNCILSARAQRNLVHLVSAKLFSFSKSGHWAKWKQHEVALKTLKDEAASKTEFLDEAKIMHSLDNDYLVKLLGVSMNGNQSILCMEFMPKGHLLGVLKSDKGKNFKLDMLGRMIASGMSYLSDQGLIHRDLRTENVLVNNSYICKIADFGLAKKSCVIVLDTKFPVKWTALEAATQGKFSVKSDVWSYGVLLWELVTFGEMPYKGMNGQDVLKNLKTGFRLQIPKEVPHKVPEKWYEQMLMCWDENPLNRPNFHSLYDFFEIAFNGPSDYVD
ncbi:tyrosine-protein kinase fyna-like [Octopus sinensis]|uniref:Tyrosine-protein kinase fyna-like n=1 Tax=Octopus sinensis TaxID=2607531 RepID=A0A6P7TXW0_9MOLL|nr:tyrosine-protein kinase fyna-like [Octopus sinensis]